MAAAWSIPTGPPHTRVVRRPDRPREILLMRRSDNRHWGLPGGYVEPGESVVVATEREVREETGYEIEVGRLVGVYSITEVAGSE